MKRIGIIGGIGPESTLDYYRIIMDAFHQGDGNYPEVIVYSANLGELMGILERGDMDRLVDWLVDKVKALDRAGAQIAAIGSNTPHVVFDRVVEISPLPLVSIVEETCSRVKELGLKKPGLMGTLLTMQSDYYARVFEKRGLEVVVPGDDDQKYIHEKLFTEIEMGVIKDETRQGLLDVIDRLGARHGIDSMILGCTELPLILDVDEYDDIKFLNTTKIHAEALIRECRG